MGSTCSTVCDVDDVKLQTAVGSCSCLHSRCGIFGCLGRVEKEIEKDVIDPALLLIEEAVKAELVVIAKMMREKLQAGLAEHGIILPVTVHTGEVTELVRALSVRVESF